MSTEIITCYTDLKTLLGSIGMNQGDIKTLLVKKYKTIKEVQSAMDCAFMYQQHFSRGGSAQTAKIRRFMK